jgi:hypothetical protein
MSEEVFAVEADGLAAESCLRESGRASENEGEGLSLEDAFRATVEMDTVSAEAHEAVMGVAPPAVYRRYQARGVTPKKRDKTNIYGITIHTPEGYEAGTLSVLSGLRAGFDAYLPLNGRFYPCNDIGRYFTWHSGHSWGNPFCIGIEQGDFAARSGSFGDAHYGRLARLCAYYCEVYDLRVEHVQGAQPGLMSHASLTPGQRTDPGASFRWADLIDLIRDYIRGTGPSPEPSPGKTIHRVKVATAVPAGKQLGAYAVESNARNHVAALKKYGIETGIETGKA